MSAERAVSAMSELELKTERFHEDEGILSPQKEAELQGRLAVLE
jgi:hypothetical protein